MFTFVVAAIFALTALFDVYITETVLRTNPDGELNPFVKFLHKHLGPALASVVGVAVPRLALGGLCWYFHSKELFALLAGGYLDHAWKQIYAKVRGLI